MENKEEKSGKKMVEVAIWLGGEWGEKTCRAWGFSPWAQQNSFSPNCGNYRRENVHDVFLFFLFAGPHYVSFLISCGWFLFLFYFLENIFGLISYVFYFILFFHFNEVPSIHNFLKHIMCYLFVLFNRDMKVNLNKLYLQSSHFSSQPNEKKKKKIQSFHFATLPTNHKWGKFKFFLSFHFSILSPFYIFPLFHPPNQLNKL